MRAKRTGLSSVYGFIVIFTLLMAGIGATITVLDAQASVWNAQDRARQVQAGQQTERLALSLNGTSLSVRNVGLVPSHLLYLYQKGSATSTDKRIDSSLQEGSVLTVPVAAGMAGFAVITSLGNIFWFYNSTQLQRLTPTIPIIFDVSSLDPSLGPATVLTVDGLTFAYASMPKTFEWAPGSLHSYSYTNGFATGSGSRVGWSYARGLSSTITGTVTASQAGSIVSTYAQQYLLTVTGGNAVTYVGSPSNDGWYNAGSSATVTANYVWSVVPAQSRLNLVSWNLDGGTNQLAPRVGAGTYATAQILMNTAHALNFNSVAQYYLTVNGGNGVILPVSQTSDGWLDSGSAVTVTTNYVWNSNGQSRLNLVSWSLDGGASHAVPRAASGTYTTPSVAMSTFHALSFNAVTQYYVTMQSGFSGSVTAPASYCGTLNTGPVSPGPNSASYSVSGNSVTYSYQIGNGCTTTWAWASLPEPYSGNSCTSLGLNGNSQVQVNPPGCWVQASSSGTDSFSIGASPSGDGWYDSGSSVALSATTSGPFSFSSWSASNGNLAIASPSSPTSSVTVNGYGALTANIHVGQ